MTHITCVLPTFSFLSETSFHTLLSLFHITFIKIVSPGKIYFNFHYKTNKPVADRTILYILSFRLQDPPNLLQQTDVLTRRRPGRMPVAALEQCHQNCHTGSWPDWPSAAAAVVL